MAYSTSSPPRLVLPLGVGGGPNLWFYTSADAKATVDASGYFTDGYNLGMRARDIVFVYDTTNSLLSCHSVITATTSAVDLSNGTDMTTATNSD